MPGTASSQTLKRQTLEQLESAIASANDHHTRRAEKPDSSERRDGEIRVGTHTWVHAGNRTEHFRQQSGLACSWEDAKEALDRLFPRQQRMKDPQLNEWNWMNMLSDAACQQIVAEHLLQEHANGSPAGTVSGWLIITAQGLGMESGLKAAQLRERTGPFDLTHDLSQLFEGLSPELQAELSELYCTTAPPEAEDAADLELPSFLADAATRHVKARLASTRAVSEIEPDWPISRHRMDRAIKSLLQTQRFTNLTIGWPIPTKDLSDAGPYPGNC